MAADKIGWWVSINYSTNMKCAVNLEQRLKYLLTLTIISYDRYILKLLVLIQIAISFAGKGDPTCIMMETLFVPKIQLY